MKEKIPSLLWYPHKKALTQITTGWPAGYQKLKWCWSLEGTVWPLRLEVRQSSEEGNQQPCKGGKGKSMSDSIAPCPLLGRAVLHWKDSAGPKLVKKRTKGRRKWGPRHCSSSTLNTTKGPPRLKRGRENLHGRGQYSCEYQQVERNSETLCFPDYRVWETKKCHPKDMVSFCRSRKGASREMVSPAGSKRSAAAQLGEVTFSLEGVGFPSSSRVMAAEVYCRF